jgi:hypothetical protein
VLPGWVRSQPVGRHLCAAPLLPSTHAHIKRPMAALPRVPACRAEGSKCWVVIPPGRQAGWLSQGVVQFRSAGVVDTCNHIQLYP